MRRSRGGCSAGSARTTVDGRFETFPRNRIQRSPGLGWMGGRPPSVASKQEHTWNTKGWKFDALDVAVWRGQNRAHVDHGRSVTMVGPMRVDAVVGGGAASNEGICPWFLRGTRILPPSPGIKPMCLFQGGKPLPLEVGPYISPNPSFPVPVPSRLVVSSSLPTASSCSISSHVSVCVRPTRSQDTNTHVSLQDGSQHTNTNPRRFDARSREYSQTQGFLVSY